MPDELQNQNIGATETPKGYSFSLLIKDILKVVSLPEELIRCVFAVVLSAKLNLYPPLWLMLVGVPSSAKTDIVSILRTLDFTYFIDSMTMNPFASGYKATGKDKTYDLLPELDTKCFICKDYTTIFSLNEETTKKLLGELVSIYDGEFSKFSPTRGYISYKSSFSHIGCITPAALNRHQKYLNIVGPRFLFYRIPFLDQTQRKAGFVISWNNTSRKELILGLQEKVKTFIDNLLENGLQVFEITDIKIRNRLEQLSLLMAKSRGIVILQKTSFTNDDGKEIMTYDVVDKQIEEPWRSLGQLKGIAISLALLENRKEITLADIKILEHIVNSSMPSERSEVLEYFLIHSNVISRDLSNAIGKSIRTCQRLLKELETLGIIISESSAGLAKNYNLHEDFKIMLNSNPPPSEFMSQLPQKEIEKYDNEEILGSLEYLRNYYQQGETQEEKTNCYKFIEKIELEAKNRNLISEKEFNTGDAVFINELFSGNG